jgi:hypothetical protein
MKTSYLFQKGHKINLGRKRKPFSDITKQKLRLANLGKKASKETRQKMKDSWIGKENPSKRPEIRKKISEMRIGKKNPAWKGGVSVNGFKKYYEQKMEKLAGREKSETCEICGAFGKDLKKGLCYDHNHTTGTFRGWICGRCNLTIGLVKENTETLMAIIEYIKKHQ